MEQNQENSNSNKNDEFKARPYQVDLLEKAIDKNIIIYLRTGSGKTFIAVMLIKHFAEEVEKPYSEGGRRTIFLANNVPLVIQQAEFIRSHTYLSVGEYYGDKLIGNKLLDSWDKETWTKELEKNHILAMSPQIFIDMLNHSFISMGQINLIIFDECHHATGNHPYSQIMNKYYTENAINLNVRVLGLTASIVHKKCNLKTFNSCLKKLEDKFGCKIETASIILDDDEMSSKKVLQKPVIKIVHYNPGSEKSSQLYNVLNKFKDITTDLDSKYSAIIRNQKEEKVTIADDSETSLDLSLFKADSENPFKVVKKELSDLVNIYEELGIWSLSIACEDAIQTIKSSFDSFKHSIDISVMDKIGDSIKTAVYSAIRQVMSEEDEKDAKKILKYSTEKVRCFVEVLRNSFGDKKIHGIVFVERKHTAYYLNRILDSIKVLDEYSFIKSDFLFGASRSNTKEVMNNAKQAIVLQKFRRHEINIMVSTNIVEEGVDIPACNMIIRFSPIHNFGSYIQSKGRARSENSAYFILADKALAVEYEKDLENFIEIEQDIELKLAKKNEDDDDDGMSSLDDIRSLNGIIKPYRKGNSEITCHTAINLVNRYCNTMETDVCGILYPIYTISTDTEGEFNIYQCSVRLPPNSVLNDTIKSDLFKRKKWAKMHAALKMCIELDKLGELADNLTILTKEEWILQHYNIKEEEKENINSKNKIGSTKNKREYKIKIADEMIDNHPKLNQTFYLYHISIKEKVFDESQKFAKTIHDNAHIGFITSKYIEWIPEFNLYKSNSVYTISIKNIKLDDGVCLDERRFEQLKKLHLLAYNQLLNLNIDFDFEDSIYGGLIVFLKESEDGEFGIDWEILDHLNLSEKTIYQQFKEDPSIENALKKNYICKFTGSKNRLFYVKSFDKTITPTSEFDRKDNKVQFSAYFNEKYELITTDLEQPMLELCNIGLNTNFLIKTSSFKKEIGKEKKSNYRELFIPEHVRVLPFTMNYLYPCYMLPNIFHRTNCLLKANQFRISIEKRLIESLKISNISNSSLDWEESIKFHRVKEKSETRTNEKKEILDEASSTSSSLLSLNELNQTSTDSVTNSFHSSEDEFEPSSFILEKNDETSIEELDCSDTKKELNIPKLIIEEDFFQNSSSTDSVNNTSLSFPNVYQILQCLTLKSANDNFDLERYEILGDCFLKLTVVLKIYHDFFKSNEGKMANLKSYRVSNRYLYKLAAKKALNDYIVSENFNARENWIAPYFSNQKNESKLKFNLSDKSIADCVEALIGVYLIQMGTYAAKSFIQWLDFEISDKAGKADFTGEYELPDPLLSKIDQNLCKKLENKYAEFEKKLGYTFKNKVYLYQAFTHPSDIKNISTSSYQKLELVGDAVLDILITQYIFADEKEHSPGELTNLRQALVNNKFFGHLAVKHNYQKYMGYQSQEVFKKLNEYTEIHKKYSPDLYYLTKQTENIEYDFDADLDPPKFLADLFESVAGAIYLDSNCSLNAVWKSYYAMLEPYLETFKKNPPQSPIKALEQLKPGVKITTTYTSIDESDLQEATVTVEEEKFTGCSTSKAQAKLIACKKAVKFFDKSNKIIFF